MGEKLWSFAISSKQDAKNQVVVFGQSGLVFRKTEEEVLEIALISAKEAYPTTEGYYGHQVVAFSISDEYILAVADEIRKQNENN